MNKTKIHVNREQEIGDTVADLRGRIPAPPPPPAARNFIFMQFSGKIGQTIGWRLPRLGNPGSATVIPKHYYFKWRAFMSWLIVSCDL